MNCFTVMQFPEEELLEELDEELEEELEDELDEELEDELEDELEEELEDELEDELEEDELEDELEDDELVQLHGQVVSLNNLDPHGHQLQPGKNAPHVSCKCSSTYWMPASHTSIAISKKPIVEGSK